MTRNSYWVAMVNECHVDSPTNEAFAFEMAENGCMEETEESICCRAAAMFGFDFERIVPLECSMRTMFEVGGVQFNPVATRCSSAWPARVEHRLRHPGRGPAVRREEGGRGVVNGKLMKERRKALGMTQMQLAVAVGASSVAMVSSWERGCTVASVPKLRKLAEVLGVTMEQLLEEEE